VDGLNLKSATAGIVLIVGIVLVALFNNSDPESDEFYHLDSSWMTENPRIEVLGQKGTIDDETIVFAAIFQTLPLEGNCQIATSLNNEPRTFYNPDYSYSSDYIYGLTYGLPDDDSSIKKINIECDVTEDTKGADWDECGNYFEISVKYPLKSGAHADTVNSQIRESVSNLVSNYLNHANERGGCYNSSLPDRSYLRLGDLTLDAFVPLANVGIFSVHLETMAHDPGAVTQLKRWKAQFEQDTLNFDLSTGQRFTLADMFYPGEESYRALQRAAVAEAQYLLLKGLRGGFGGNIPDVHFFEKDEYRPELLEKQEFALTEDAIVLDCTKYCGVSPVAHVLDRKIPLEIPYSRLKHFFDPDGPFRHISKN